MPEFAYEVKDVWGKIKSGTTSVESRKRAILDLTQEGGSLISLKELNVSGGEKFSVGFNKVNQEEISVFTRQLASLLKAGLPLIDSLTLLSKKISRVKFRKKLEDIIERIVKGGSYSSALEVHSDVFSQLYIHMVKAGEASGTLEKVLTRLAHIIDRNVELKRKVKSALIYPTTILFVGIGTIAFLVIYVIPKFSIMFSEMQQALPLPTAIIMGTSAFIREFWWGILAVVFAFCVAINRFAKSKNGKNILDRLILKIPVVGPIIEKEIVSSFSRILGTLIASGIPMLQSLEIVGRMIDNSVFVEEIDRLKNSITKGRHMSKALQESSVFPDIVTSLLSVGEESGTLEDVLREVADIYERDVERKIRDMIILIEPVMIVCMACFVGFIVLSMLLPIFRMGTILQ